MSMAKRDPITIAADPTTLDPDQLAEHLLARFEALYSAGEKIFTLHAPEYRPEGEARDRLADRLCNRRAEIGDQMLALRGLSLPTLIKLARTLDRTYWTDLTDGYLNLIDCLIANLAALPAGNGGAVEAA